MCSILFQTPLLDFFSTTGLAHASTWRHRIALRMHRLPVTRQRLRELGPLPNGRPLPVEYVNGNSDEDRDAS